MEVGGAVLGRLEDDRVDEPDERGVGDAVVGLEVVLGVVRFDVELVLDERGAFPHLARARDLAQLELDVLARRDADVELIAGREAKLVDLLDVARVGDRDLEDVSLEAVRDRSDPVEDVRLDRLDGVLLHGDLGEVDEGEVVARRERLGDPDAVAGAVVRERGRERPRAGARLGLGELVHGDEAGRLEEVREELRRAVRPDSGPGRGHGRQVGEIVSGRGV